MAAEDYQPNFFLRLMAKDITYAIREAADKGHGVARKGGENRLRRILGGASALA